MLRPVHSAVFIIFIGSLYLLTIFLYHNKAQFQLKTGNENIIAYNQDKIYKKEKQNLNNLSKQKGEKNKNKPTKNSFDNKEKQAQNPNTPSEQKNEIKKGFNHKSLLNYSLVILLLLLFCLILYLLLRFIRKKTRKNIESIPLGNKRGTNSISKNFQNNLVDRGFTKNLTVAAITNKRTVKRPNELDVINISTGFKKKHAATDNKFWEKFLFFFLKFYSTNLSNPASFSFRLKWADFWAVLSSIQLFFLLYLIGIEPFAAAIGLSTLVLINSGLFRQSNLLFWSSITLNALGAITWAIYGLYETFKHSEPVKINYDFSFNWDISYRVYIVPTVILLITVYMFLKYIKRITYSLSFIFTFLKLLFLDLFKFFSRRFQAEVILLHEIYFFICGISFLFFYWILGAFTLFKSSFLIASIANIILWIISPRGTADIEKQWKIDPFKLIIIIIGSLIFTLRFYNDADLNIIAYWLTTPVLFTAIFVFIFFKEFDRKALSEKIAENNLKNHEDSLILDLSNKNLNDTDIVLRSLDKYTERLTAAGLKSLNISDNNLLFFPPEIFEIKSLEKLNISNNRIGILSEKLRELPHLKELNLENNRLKSLPLWLAELNALETLNIKGNEIKAENILQLKNLSPLINIIH